MGKKQGLLEAARSGNVLEVSRLLNSSSSGVNSVSEKVGKVAHKVGVRLQPLVNKSDENGATALHLAALEGHLDVVKILLNNGAQINVLDNRRCTVLHYACYRGRKPILDELINHAKSSRSSPSTSTPVGNADKRVGYRNPAINSNSPSSTQLDLDSQNADGETAMHIAATFNHTKCVALLLEHGANPLLVSQIGESPLDVAVRNFHVETVIEIAPHIPLAVKQIRNISGHSAVHEAAKRGDIRLLKVLIDSGFDINSVNELGSALHVAVHCRKPDIFALLIATKKCDLRLVDNSSKTVPDLITQALQQTNYASIEAVREMEKLLNDVSLAQRRVAHLLSDDDHQAAESPIATPNVKVDASEASSKVRIAKPRGAVSPGDSANLNPQTSRNRDDSEILTPTSGATRASARPPLQPKPKAAAKLQQSAISDLEDMFGCGPSVNQSAAASASVLKPTQVNQPPQSTDLKAIKRKNQSAKGSDSNPAAPSLPPRCPPPPSGPGFATNRMFSPKLHRKPPPVPTTSPNIPVSKPAIARKPTLSCSVAILRRFPCLSEIVSSTVDNSVIVASDISGTPCEDVAAATRWYASSQGSLRGWLSHVGYPGLEDAFIAAGYENLHFINGMFDYQDLSNFVVDSNELDGEKLMRAASQLPSTIGRVSKSVEDWLVSLHLDSLYADALAASGYSTMSQCCSIRPGDLTRVGIVMPGHRSRILESLQAQRHAGNSLPTDQDAKRKQRARRPWWPIEPAALLHGYYPFRVIVISFSTTSKEEYVGKSALLFVSCDRVKFIDGGFETGNNPRGYIDNESRVDASAQDKQSTVATFCEHDVSDVTEFGISESATESIGNGKLGCTFTCSYRLLGKARSISHQSAAIKTITIGTSSRELCVKIAKTLAEASDVHKILFGTKRENLDESA